MRRYTGAFVVLGVFIVLLAVVLLTQQNSNNNPTDTAAAATPTVSQADKDLQILSIPVTDTISQLDLKTITGTASLKLDAGAWKQTAPKPLDLDSSVISSTVDQLRVLKGSTYISADKATDLKSYGLDNPSLVVTMTATSGVKTLQFGALNQASKNYYVKLAGDGRVWTVSSAVVDAITVLQTAPPTPAPTIGVTSGPLTPLPSVTPSPTAGTPTEAGGPTATPTPIQTIPGGTPGTATIVPGTTGPATATPVSTPSPTTAAPPGTATTAASTTGASTTSATTTGPATSGASTTSAVTTAATTTTAPATTQ